MLLLHVHSLEANHSGRSSLWQTIQPSVRVVCAVLCVFAISLTPNAQWMTWGVYGLGLWILTSLSLVQWPVLVQRIAIESVFVSVVVIGSLFQTGSEVLWQWGWMQVTVEGLTILASVLLKAILSLWTLNLLVLTTSVPTLLHALVQLRVPPILVAIFASMYRYIAVLAQEFQTMQRAAIARNLLRRHRSHRRIVGNMIGGLFIRSYERGDRVHRAMLARGGTGIPEIADRPKFGRSDRWGVVAVIGWIVLGQLAG